MYKESEIKFIDNVSFDEDKSIVNNEETIKLKNEEENVEYEKEKGRFINVLKNIKDKMDMEPENPIRYEYLSYSADEFLKNKEVRRDVNCGYKLCYKFFLSVITSIYLIGLFLIVPFKKSVEDLLWSSIKCKIEINCNKEEFMEQANFFEYSFEKLTKEPINLNLVMICNIIGIKLSNAIDICWTSVIFLFCNILILLYTYNIDYTEYEPETCKYSYAKIIIIIINWVLMALFFGGSSLYVQQRLIDHYALLDGTELDKLKNFENNENKNDVQKAEEQAKCRKKRNFKSLFIFAISNFIGYIGKYGISIALTYYKQEIIDKNNGTIYNNSTNNNDSLYLYTYYLSTNISNNSQSNDTNIIVDNNELNQNIFIYISLIYCGCILFSGIILYPLLICYFFKKKETKKGKSEGCCLCNISCEIFGCIIYFERTFADYDQEKLISNKTEKQKKALSDSNMEKNKDLNIPKELISITEDNSKNFYNSNEKKIDNQEQLKELQNTIKEENEKKCECKDVIITLKNIIFGLYSCFRLICETINNYCDNAICNMCNCRDDKTKNFCICCCKYNEEHFDKHKQCFCYCYQEKSFCYWVNKFIVNETQKEVIIFFILYFLSKLCVIACEKKYEQLIYESDILEEKPYFLIALGVFSLLMLYGFIIICYQKYTKKQIKNNIEDYGNEGCFFGKLCSLICVNKINKALLLISIIFLINIFLGQCYSVLLLGRENIDYKFPEYLDKVINEKVYLYATILSNEIFIFVINYYCLILINNQINFGSLIPQTILVSVYTLIVNFLLYLIKYILNNFISLVILQYIVSNCLSYVILISFLLLFLISIIKTFAFCCQLCTCYEYDKGIINCNSCCCKTNSSCYSKCCDSNCSECNCEYLCCEIFEDNILNYIRAHSLNE